MALKKTALQTLSGIAAIGLTLGIAAPANAGGLPENVGNYTGGGVNIRSFDTCVNKVGDTAHVKFEAQHQPLITSQTHSITAASGTLALPHNLKNVKIKIVAVGGVDNFEGAEGRGSAKTFVKFDNPIELPIVDYKDTEYGTVPSLGVEKQEKKQNIDGVEHTNYLPTEEELREDIASRKVAAMRSVVADKDSTDHNTEPFMAPYHSVSAWYGDHDREYDYYQFGNLFMPLSLEIEGDIETTAEEMYATAAVSNLGWKSAGEEMAGSFGYGSQFLNGYPAFQVGFLPPAAPDDENMVKEYQERSSSAGLDISPQIAPTRELPGDAKYTHIGDDIRPSARGNVGEAFIRNFSLYRDPNVLFVGSAQNSGEDGADIAASHVTLCPAEETPETDVPETDVPDTETPETETPDTETPETETPETETPETETPETETPETETPETEVPNTDTPDTETPETDVPETETPNTDAPDTETPETEVPNTDVPETDTPETETPETETPETDTPAPAPSNDGDTGSRTLASTGASVIGIGVVALVLIGAGIFLSRRKKD